MNTLESAKKINNKWLIIKKLGKFYIYGIIAIEITLNL